MKTLKEIYDEMEAKASEAKAIIDAADEEAGGEGQGVLTEEQSEQVSKLYSEYDNLKAEAEKLEERQAQTQQARERLSEHQSRMAETDRRSQASTPRQQERANDNNQSRTEHRVSSGVTQDDINQRHGFKSFGEFAQAVMASGRRGIIADERLNFQAGSATTSATEGTGADGGFLVPPQFSERIYRHALMEDAFLPLTDRITVQGNSMRFPADETTPWGTNGVQARWEGEAVAATQDKPALKTRELRLHKLISLVPVTEELLEDGMAVDTYLESRMTRAIRWKINDALINGTGAGQPQGVTTANALVQPSRNTNNEINFIDVANMMARMPSDAVSRAVWLANNDALPQIMTMTNGNQPVFTAPDQGATEAPAGRLLGRPVRITQTAASVGSANDIMFVDFMSMVAIEKAQGIRTSQSVHLFFDADQTAFKATFRIDAQPWLDSSITPNNGSNNLSPFVGLAA